MRFAILALPGLYPGCLSAILDVARLTNAHGMERLKENDPDASLRSAALATPWTPALLTVDGQAVTAGDGQTVKPEGAARQSETQFDAVFVPGFAFASLPALEKQVAKAASVSAWLRRQRDGGAVIAGNHTGLYILAQAGLFDQGVATIPFSLEKHFRKRFPRVKLDMSRAIVETRQVLGGAGLSTGYDLAWRVIQRHNSAAVAHRVFEDLFFESRASAAETGHDISADPMIERAQSWLLRHLADKVTMAELAHYVSASQRTLFRRFEKALGVTPHAYLTSLRLETAKKGLIHTAFRIDQLAAGVGYKDAAFFAQLFQTHTGLSPSLYRRKYQLKSASMRASTTRTG